MRKIITNTGSHWMMLIGILILATGFRLSLNLSSILIPGINGGYYPLMIRGAIINHHLPFEDLPLLFWLETIWAKLFLIFSSNRESAIIMASKTADCILPVIAAIPVYLLSRKNKLKKATPFILAGFTILFFPSSYLLTGDMHKNALALVWLAALFRGMEEYRSNCNLRNGLQILIFFILLGLTHFGTLMIGFLALPFIISMPFKQTIRSWWLKRNLGIIILLLLIVLITSSLFFLIPGRMNHLLSLIGNPFRIFEHPILWYLLDGQKVLTPFLLGFGLTIQILSLGVLIISLRMKRGIYWALLATIISSPLIGIEWYLRLAIMAHIPLVFGLIAIWPVIKPITRWFLQSTLFVLIVSSLFLVATGRRSSSISESEIIDFQVLKNSKIIKEYDLIIARHGLEWWTSWYLSCHIAQEQAIQAEDFMKYERIMILHQYQGKTGRFLRGQANFNEPQKPADAVPLWQGEVLQLYLIESGSFQFVDPESKLISTGKIFQNQTGQWFIKNQLYTNEMILTSKQKAKLSSTYQSETSYRVYGKRKPFSLKIKIDKVSPMGEG